jgi:hypothetical protein
LPPRPVARCAAPYDSADQQLWLLPLVDSRYWWRDRNTADLEITSSTTWASLFSTLGSALGITVAMSGVDAAYLSPDTYEFTRRYENAAMMLDAAALSVGKRIVRRRDGTVRAESNADAQAAITAAATRDAKLLAGGYYHLESGYRPEKVTCTFRKWRHYRVLQKGQVYTVDVQPAIATALATGTNKVVHSTMFADYSSDTSPPANTADLDALAQVIGDDFYGWLRSRYDITFAGAQNWELNGFDDSVVWDFGRQVVGGAADGVRLGQTRVQSMPVDFGFDLQLSQKNTLTLFESPMVCKPDANIAAGDRGTVSVWEGRSGEKIDSTLDVEAYSEAGATAGEFVVMRWIEDDWELDQPGGETTEIVEVYHSGASPGDVVEANASNVHPGRIKRFSESDGMETFDDIWIGFTDNFDVWAGNVLAVQNEYYGPAKPSGSFTVGEDTRTLYLVTHGERHWDAFAYDEIVAGEANLVEFMEWDDGDSKFMPTGIRWDAQDFFLNAGETVEAGTKLQVKWRGPRLEITNMYCSKSDDEDIEAALPSEE